MTASLTSCCVVEADGGYASSSWTAVVADAHVILHFRNSSSKYFSRASYCLGPGGGIDHDVGVECCVRENKVGGGCRQCSVRAGKSMDRGSKSKGIESISMNCLEREKRYGRQHGDPGLDLRSGRERKKKKKKTYLAALQELIISRSASSAALAVSTASCTFCFHSYWALVSCRLTNRGGGGRRAESGGPSPLPPPPPPPP